MRLTSTESAMLDSLQVHTIYLKLFDVAWDASTQHAIPVAKLSALPTGIVSKYKIIPTVFITNESIQKTDSSALNTLAFKVHGLIRDICAINKISHPGEIQIDCDWTTSTRDKYFSLLKSIAKLNPATTLSATIRLHQVKYVSASGIPPVDRGLLMCYNMGNLKNPATKNSILDVEEFRKYTGNLATYPLPLDVALPLFDWKVLFRRNEYKGLIQDLPDEALTASFCRQQANRSEILTDTLLYGYDLKKGDILRSEQSNFEDIVSVAEEVNSRIKNTNMTVALYHLDSVTLSKYTLHELESIYSFFR